MQEATLKSHVSFINKTMADQQILKFENIFKVECLYNQKRKTKEDKEHNQKTMQFIVTS